MVQWWLLVSLLSRTLTSLSSWWKQGCGGHGSTMEMNRASGCVLAFNKLTCFFFSSVAVGRQLNYIQSVKVVQTGRENHPPALPLR